MLISSLAAPGGAERVLCTLANEWVRTGAEVVLITIDTAESDFFEIDGRVQRVGLGLMSAARHTGQGVLNNARRLRELRLVLKRTAPDVLISFIDITNVLALIATRGMNMPVIVSERINAQDHPIGRVWMLLRRALYPRADAVVVQTHGMGAWASRFVGQRRIRVIPNAVRAPRRGRGEDSGSAGRRLLAIGRLTHQKGFDMLLDALSRCRNLRAGDHVLIVGEGTERAALEQTVEELGLAHVVSLTGRRPDAADMLTDADVFVLSSRYEGFPNVLLEAMAAGVACVSFDCAYGPGEIIRHEIDGLLVDPGDVDGLAAAIDRLLGDPGLRARLAARARDVAERFSLAQVMTEWNTLLESAAEGRAAA